MSWSECSFWVADNFGIIAGVCVGAVMVVSVMRRNQHHQRASKLMQDAVKKDLHEPVSLHPEVNLDLCTGCGACVAACPEGEILQLIDHHAHLVAPTKCVGHGQCEAACPFDAIALVFGTRERGKELPRISAHFETNVRGLYIAGELGGMGLIRNAVRQGRMAVEHASTNLSGDRAHLDYDVVIIGAGPAGLAASLAAHGAKVRYLCIEQGLFGGTIASFPRQKMIMSQPADLPVVGPMKFPRHKVAKQDLMDRWQEIRAQVDLKIKENTRFVGLTPLSDGGLTHFLVKTSNGDFKAQKVVLATGVRGTPRKLKIPGEDLAKVTYNLIEPEQYKECHVAVVGSGNAAAEAVQFLCAESLNNTVTMVIRTADFDRCNEENENAVKALALAGRVRLCYHAALLEIQQDEVLMETLGRKDRLRNDFVFVFIGAEVEKGFFEQLGIQIDKKFGEPLARTVAAK